MKSVCQKIVTIAGLILMVACGKNAPTYSILPDQNIFKGTSTIVDNKIDILWVVDNSGSMGPLQTNMVNNFNSFISGFQKKGYDFRMSVTGTDAYLGESQFKNNDLFFAFRDGTDSVLYNSQSTDTHSGIFMILPTTLNLNSVFVTNATQGQQGSGDERAFSSFKEVLKSPKNNGFVRPNSFLAVIILSDEDDFSSPTRTEGSWGNNPALDHCYVDPTMDGLATTGYSGNNHVSTCANQAPPETVDSYVQFLDTLTSTSGINRRYNVSAITVLDNACLQKHTPETSVTIIGQRYMQIAQKTNGALGSICDTSFSNSLIAIQARISELATRFTLTRVPIESTIHVVINSVTIPKDSTNGWTYDSSTNTITFHGTATPEQGSSVVVDFDPMTVKSS